MAERKIVDVVTAATDLIYTVDAFNAVEEFEIAYKLAKIAQEVVGRCGISPSAKVSMDNIVANLEQRLEGVPQSRTLN